MRITKRQLRRIIREEVSRARSPQRRRRHRLYEATMSPEELDQILQQHELWLGTDWVNGRAQGERADLSVADLRGVDLSGAQLSKAFLSEADLTDADLSGADLTWAVLHNAKLHGANLSGADLANATLIDAWLPGADLSGADLTDANLLSTNLTGVQISADTRLQGTDFRYSTCSPDDLSWLALHPKWPEWKDTMRVKGMTPEEVTAYSSNMSDAVVEARIRNTLSKYTR